ncbi:MAG: DUF6506 family protein [Rhodospirillaceae bacterium]|nr:DUF6506 family protein [Rhodospirillaceae bacterium]
MTLEAAFIFIAPDADPRTHRSVVDTPAVRLTTLAVKDYDEAVEETRKLVENGVAAIELCGGFGHEGVARIAEAVGDRAAVGVVRFDNHPGLGFKSGDSLF